MLLLDSFAMMNQINEYLDAQLKTIKPRRRVQDSAEFEERELNNALRIKLNPSNFRADPNDIDSIVRLKSYSTPTVNFDEIEDPNRAIISAKYLNEHDLTDQAKDFKPRRRSKDKPTSPHHRIVLTSANTLPISSENHFNQEKRVRRSKQKLQTIASVSSNRSSLNNHNQSTDSHLINRASSISRSHLNTSSIVKQSYNLAEQVHREEEKFLKVLQIKEEIEAETKQLMSTYRKSKVETKKMQALERDYVKLMQMMQKSMQIRDEQKIVLDQLESQFKLFL